MHEVPGLIFILVREEGRGKREEGRGERGDRRQRGERNQKRICILVTEISLVVNT